LFATGDSQTRARLVASAPSGYSEDPNLDAKAWECLHISSLFERAQEFDLIHNSFDFLPLSFSGLVDTPMVTTIHGFSSERIVPVYQKYDATNHYVSISDADRHPTLHYAATIHHGIDIDSLALGTKRRSYLLFFGRIHPEKGTKEAIAIAAGSGLPLIIAGIIQDRDYFEQAIRPHIDGDRVQYLGAVGAEQKDRLLGGARALLHYVSFHEPFGFSVVEAMACGTPVVATPLGSMPEIVQPGVNGQLVESMAEAITAVQQLEGTNPSQVRASVAERFHVRRMVDDYVALYERILDGTVRPSSAVRPNSA
jgi:glycosyltransferase involved in cell wall biosynthesis